MKFNRPVFSWCLYDWASSAFATTVMAGFFPGFFKKFWCVGVDPAISTFRLGIGEAVGGVLIAVLAPLLGAVAGTHRLKKKLLTGFALMGIAGTGYLAFIEPGDWVAALIVYTVSWMGFAFANLFYDSLLPDVAGGETTRYDAISSRGFAFGYAGGGILLVINVLMFNSPQLFGISNGTAAIRIAFLTVCGWWLLFTIPLVLFVSADKVSAGARVTAGVWADLRQTIGEIRRNRTVWMFLIAYWLYIDGVNTIIVMATDFGLSIGIPLSTAMMALIVVQFVAFPSSLFFGSIASRWNTRNAILLGVGGYAVIAVAGAWMLHTPAQYLGFAVAIGLVQGGVQALSRSFYATLIPAEKSAEYFGFYNLVGRFAVVGGPAIVAFTNLAVHGLSLPSQVASRAGISALALLFIAGGILLLKGTTNQRTGSGATA